MLQVKRSFPITAEYVAEFNSINNTNFKLKHLYCTACQATCDCDCILNPLLNELLQGTMFLCISKQCAFKGSMAEFHNHCQQCVFGSLKCPLDRKPFQNAYCLFQHFATHKNVKKYKMDSLSLLIHLNLKNKADKIVIAEYKKNFFVVLINYDTEDVSFKVGKYLVCDSNTLPTYTLIHDYERRQIQQKGDVLPLASLLNYEQKYTSMIVKLNLLKDNPEVTINFFDYKYIKMNLSECPICFNAIVCEFTQCINGHAFCVTCASKFTTCAVCRQGMMNAVRVNLKYVLSDHDFPCDNLEEGCLALLKLDERENHKKVCAFRVVECPYCKKEFRALTICDHFQKNHLCINNYDSIPCSINSIYFQHSRFLIYRQKVFNVNTYFAERHVRCLVELVNDDVTADKYRYELIVKDISNTVVGRTSNVCAKRFDSMLKPFSATTRRYYSSINLEPFKDKLFNNGRWNIVYNYNITLCKDVFR